MKHAYSDELSKTLLRGGIAIMLTDTIYGIVGRADNEATVERIYEAKQRTPSKSPIVLIGDISQMFDAYSDDIARHFAEYWPGSNSLILPSTHAPEWITRGNNSVAYRLPGDENLRALLRVTGPLIAPSANPEGEPPATTIAEAKAYFGDTVDHYEDGGHCATAAPSSLYDMRSGSAVKIR